MDVVWLARLQFAITIMFHFLFPPISIGLGFLIFLLETARRRTGKDVYRRASDFWLKIFAVTFVVGVASGIVMEFQFGTNWASYSRFVGDVFGAPLAAEGILAFFLESGFLGLRSRASGSPPSRAGSRRSWSPSGRSFRLLDLVANSWMQTPAGYRIVDGAPS
jgi:cytochrome d ubiquinol oxidase subunit I